MDWFVGKNLAAEVEPSEPEQDGSPYTGERDQAKRPAPEPKPPKPTPPGWYETEGTLRYFDGKDWTDHLAPPRSSLNQTQMAGAVFLGVFFALFLVWLGAQIEPDTIYLPVKFVVEELPEGF